MRHIYTLKWKVFVNWCVSRHEDLASCDILTILTFLQERLDAGSTPSTLKVYVADITASHDMFEGRSVGKYETAESPRSHLLLVYLGLITGAQCAVWPTLLINLKVLSFKMALLLTLVCGKRVGDPHALLVSSACMQFGPDDCLVRLMPRHGYTPEVLSMLFRAQVIYRFSAP